MSLAVVNDHHILPPPTTSSVVVNGGISSSSGSSSSGSNSVGGYTLQINENISLCPFVNKPFPIQLYLLDDKKQLVVGRSNIPIDVQLFYHGHDSTPIPITNDLCKIEPANLVINNLGILEMKVTFLQLSMNHNNRKFFFRFSIKSDIVQAMIAMTHTSATSLPVLMQTTGFLDALPSSSSSVSNVVEDVIAKTNTTSSNTNAGTSVNSSGAGDLIVNTPPLHVVRLRLVSNVEVHNSLAFGPEEEINLPTSSSSGGNNAGATGVVGGGGTSKDITKIWYKDEGGKDHGVDLHVMLVDSDPYTTSTTSEGPTPAVTPVLQQSVPYTISLIYSNGEPVPPRPNLFTILPENSSCVIDRNSGKSWKKVRINDISKNHQKQCFVIRVQPDLTKNPYLFDIAGDDSVAIEVRSKRTKKQRESSGPAGSTNANANTAANGASTGASASASVPETSSSTGTVGAAVVNHSDAYSSGVEDSVIDMTVTKSTVKKNLVPPVTTNNPPSTIPNTTTTATATATSSSGNSSTKNKNNKSATLPSYESDEVADYGYQQTIDPPTKRPRLPPTASSAEHIAPFIPTTRPPQIPNAMPIAGRNNVYPPHMANPSNTNGRFKSTTDSIQSNRGIDGSLQVLLTWTEHVLQAFEELRWQQIGFVPSDRDKNVPDTSRPLYNMPNPNVIFDRLQQEYSSRVYDSLNALMTMTPSIGSLQPGSSETTTPNASSTGAKAKREAKATANGGTTKRSSKKNTAKENNTSTPATPAESKEQPPLHFVPMTSNTGYPMYPAHMNYHPFANGNIEDPMHYHAAAAMYNQHHHLHRPRGNSLAPTNGYPMQPPPQQQQQQSVIHHDSQPPYPGNSRAPALPAASSHNTNSNNGHITDDESTVYYIVAVPYDMFRNIKAASSNEMELYFPAYDMQQELVGFYTEMKDDRNATIIRFYSINSPLPFNPNSPISSVIDMSKAKQFLASYLYGPSNNADDDCSDEVYSLPRAGYNLESMKHDAMVHYWLAEVGLDDF